MSDLPAQHAFDYAALPPAAADVARQAASIIRRHGQTAARAIVRIGTELAATKAALPHGAWLPWLEMEFGWAERTAQNFMRVAEFVKSATVADLEPFDLRALYVLSAPSTSPTVQAAALTLAQSGERVTHAAVKSLRAAHDVVEAKGAAVLRDAVDAGHVSLRDAEPIARLPKTVQREAVADIRSGEPVATVRERLALDVAKLTTPKPATVPEPDEAEEEPPLPLDLPQAITSPLFETEADAEILPPVASAAETAAAPDPLVAVLDRLPGAVFVPSRSEGDRHVAISRVKVRELRAAIEAQTKQVELDIQRIRDLEVFLNNAIAAGAADDDIVASRLSLAAE